MSSSTLGSDENISASKIEPLESGQKHGVEHELNSDGVIGNDKTIDQTRIDPVGGAGQYRHPEPRTDTQGVIGYDEAVQGAKIDPLDGKADVAGTKTVGLDDEEIDGARIKPLGEVREELS